MMKLSLKENIKLDKEKWSVTIPKELRDRETDLLNGVNVWNVCRYIDGGNVDSLTVRKEICCDVGFSWENIPKKD